MTDKKDYKLFKVAYSYYIDKLTQDQISKIHGISRSSVSMMLNEARNRGIVEFHVRFPDMYRHDLEEDLEKKFKLKKVKVISEFYDNDQEKVSLLADACVEYLSTIIRDYMTIGVSWGKNVYEVASKIDFTGASKLTIVPIVGGIGNEINHFHSNIIAQKMAENLRAKALGLYAPVFVGSKDYRDAIMEDTQIRSVLEKAKKSDIALVGIGNIFSSTMTELNIINKEDVKGLSNLGAIGDINTVFIDKDGNEVNSDFRDRTINISLEELKNIKTVVAVAGGIEKSESVLASIKSGAIDVLITDELVANRLLGKSKNELE